MVNNRVFSTDQINQFLSEVQDPEIPVLNVVEMGIVRDVFYRDDLLIVTVTPTYSGCPATETIRKDIEEKLREKGITSFSVITTLAPAWTTDWITPEAREKLRKYGIAPPEYSTADKRSLAGQTREVKCPRCGSVNTIMKSQFGSTPCKALYQCNDCREPFDLFKCI